MSKKRKWSGASKRSVRRYRAYRRELEARADKMIEKGLTPFDAIPLSYREYKEQYLMYLNDRQKEIEKGERRSVGNINAKIVSDQVYELSEDQAYAIFDYIKKMDPEERRSIDFSFRNINEAIAKIRQGEFVKEDLGLWEVIEVERESLLNMKEQDRAAFITKYKAKNFKDAVKKYISHTMFGSPI